VLDRLEPALDRIEQMPHLDADEVYSLDSREVAELQLTGLQYRFETLRPRIRAVSSLADDLGITAVRELEDVVPLCLPHTMYKSYSGRHLENGRYDRLSEWLDGLTTEDLSGVDVSGCDSLESWLSALEQHTALRPCVSSGTTGKISFFPRSSAEGDTWVRFTIQAMGGFGDEPASGVETGKPEFFSPMPVATGRQTFVRMLDGFRRLCYGGDGSRIHTLGQGHWDADMLWLSGRMRAAEARGETAELELTPALERVRDAVLASQAQAAANVDRFLQELIVGQRGKPIILFAPGPTLFQLARLCRERALEPSFGEGTFILTGGGSKGAPLPEDWEERVFSVFPPPHQSGYGMTEATGVCRLCSAGWFHWPPTIVIFVLDPDTGVPLPRSGTQTGRLALYDLCPTTHWGGAITGDEITIDWEGGCPCGRNGPRIMNNVTRYTDMRGDDKITCALSPGAYERAVDNLIGVE
jgi:hypothetical protein